MKCGICGSDKELYPISNLCKIDKKINEGAYNEERAYIKIMQKMTGRIPDSFCGDCGCKMSLIYYSFDFRNDVDTDKIKQAFKILDGFDFSADCGKTCDEIYESFKNYPRDSIEFDIACATQA